MSGSNLRKTIALGSFGIFLLAEFFMFHDFFYPFRFLWNQGKIIEFSLSLVLFVWSLSGAFLLFFCGRSLLRKITLPFFLFFAFFNIASFNIANSPIDFQQTVMIVQNFRWWLWALIENYGLAALPILITLIPAIILVERLPEFSKLNIPKNFYLVPISALIFTIVGLQHSHGFFDRYPSFFRIPSMLAFASQSRIYDGERSEVTYSGSLDTDVEKIVLVVDESVRADILGINAYEKYTTPYLRSLETGIVNFGLAA